MFEKQPRIVSLDTIGSLCNSSKKRESKIAKPVKRKHIETVEVKKDVTKETEEIILWL